MSYREPKIIDDKSGLALGQAIAAGAQNISKGLIAGQARKEKEEAKAKLEAEKKQAKEDRRIFQTSKAIKDSYADQAAWAKKLDGDLEGLNDFTVQQMNGYMDIAKNLELERINGAYGPDYLKRLEDNQKNIARVNEFASGIIGARADAGAVIDMTEEQRDRDTAFIPITIEGVADNGELAEDAVYAIGGLKGYDIGFSDKGVKITRPGEDDAYIAIDTWNSISGNLYYNRKDNTTTNMQAAITKGMQIPDATGKSVLDSRMISTTPTGIGTETVTPGTKLEPVPMGINANGYYTYRQPFNKEAVNNLKTEVLDSVFEKIESFGPQAYKKNVWMKDLERGGFDRVVYNNIGSAEYMEDNPNATEADIKAAKKQYVVDSAEAQFLSIANLKKDGDEYYRTIQGRKVSSTDSKKEVKLSETYNKYATGLSSIKALETKQEKIAGIIKLAALGEGAQIAKGTSPKYVGNLRLTNDYIVQFGKELTGGENPKYKGYDLKKPEEAENFIRNKTGLSGKKLDVLVQGLLDITTKE